MTFFFFFFEAQRFQKGIASLGGAHAGSDRLDSDQRQRFRQARQS